MKKKSGNAYGLSLDIRAGLIGAILALFALMLFICLIIVVLEGAV